MVLDGLHKNMLKYLLAAREIERFYVETWQSITGRTSFSCDGFCSFRTLNFVRSIDSIKTRWILLFICSIFGRLVVANNGWWMVNSFCGNIAFVRNAKRPIWRVIRGRYECLSLQHIYGSTFQNIDPYTSCCYYRRVGFTTVHQQD